MTKKKRRPPAKLCGGKLTSRPGTCGHSAGWGTEHNGRGRCMFHGGKTPTHVKAAQREAAAEAVVTYGLPREIEPTDALLEEIHRTAGIVQWLEIQIRTHEPDELVWGESKAVDGSTEEAAAPSVWVKLYQQERRHLVAVCRTAIAAGIAERQIQIAEHQAAMFATALRGIVEDLGVADHPDLGKIVRHHLTLIEGGKE